MTRNVGHIARLFPALQQAAGLVVGGETAVGLVEIAVVVDHIPACHPAELGAETEALPGEDGSEAALPRGVAALSEQYAVAVTQFVGDIAVLVVPEGVTVGRIDSRITVHIEFPERMADHELGVGIRILVLIDSVVEFGDTVEVISEIGVEVPGEIPYAQEFGDEVELDSGIDHTAHVLPAVAISVRLGVGERHRHKHIGGVFVIELQVQVQTAPEAGVEAQVGGPATLPGKVVVARLHRTHRAVTHIVAVASEQFEMLVVRDGGVACGSAAEGYLGVAQPVAGGSGEIFVAQVPHEAHGTEDTPAVVASEAGGTVSSQGALEVIFVTVAVLSPSEEGYAGIVLVRIAGPRSHPRREGNVGEQVVGLSLAGHGEALGVVVLPFLTYHKGEVVHSRQIEPVGQGVGYLQVERVAGRPRSRSLCLVRGIAREGLAEAGHVGVIGGELGAEREVFVEFCLDEAHCERLVFLVFHRIVGNPFERVLSLSLPAAVGNRGQGAVLPVRIPVREHEAGG